MIAILATMVVAFIESGLCMSPLVFSPVTTGSEGFVAELAIEWSFPGVHALVNLKVRFVLECSSAHHFLFFIDTNIFKRDVRVEC